jgi:hypothetical protein
VPSQLTFDGTSSCGGAVTRVGRRRPSEGPLMAWLAASEAMNSSSIGLFMMSRLACVVSRPGISVNGSSSKRHLRNLSRWSMNGPDSSGGEVVSQHHHAAITPRLPPMSPALASRLSPTWPTAPNIAPPDSSGPLWAAS